jgi:predicted tellurium resistance membrane protein TerC
MQQFFIIFLLNFLTSIDNAIILGGIINRSKYILVIGLTSVLIITGVRTLVIMSIVTVVQWPGLRFALGVVVLFVAISLARAQRGLDRDGTSFWRVLFVVVVTDTALSVDNILSIAVVSKDALIIATSVFLSLLPISLLLPVIVRVMNQATWLRIIAAGFVAELGIDSITDDPVLVQQLPNRHLEIAIRVSAAMMVILYGIWQTYGIKRKTVV